MKMNKHNEGEIVKILREAEQLWKVEETCGKHNISSAGAL